MKNMKRSHLLLQLITSCLAIIALTVVATIIGYHYFRDPFKHEVFGSLGTLIQGTLGVGVSLAGAFVAITIASVSYELLSAEQYREDFILLAEKMENAVAPIQCVARCMAALFALEIRGELEKSRHFKVDESTDWSAFVSISDVPYRSALASALTSLSEAVLELSKNSYSLYVWRSCSADRELWLQSIELGKSGTSLSVRDDLLDLAIMLRMYATDAVAMNKISMNDLAVPRIVRNMTPIVGKQQTHNAGVGTLVELGVEMCPVCHDNVYTNLGLAILHDLACCIPSETNKLHEILKELFGDLGQGVDLRRIPLLRVADKLGHFAWYGSSLAAALKDLDLERPRLVVDLKRPRGDT